MNFYRAKRPEPAEGLTAYGLPFIFFTSHQIFAKFRSSIFSWQTLIEQCTLLEGIGSNGFSDRRILSFVLTVYSLHHSFATQTEQPGCSIPRNSSVNRNCTVLHAWPNT